MTMLTFRVDERVAADLQRWVSELGVDRSQLLREALHRHLVALASEIDAATWEANPLTEGEIALGDVADWGPAEDWSDWTDAPG